MNNAIKFRFYIVLGIVIITAFLVMSFNRNFLLEFNRVNQVVEAHKNQIFSTQREISLYQKIVVLVNDIETEKMLYSNIENCFHLAKMNYEMVHVNSLDLDKIKELDDNDILVIATEQFDYDINQALIEDFLNRGGHLVSLIRTNNQRGNKYYGIIENNGFVQKDVIGFKIIKSFFPGLDDTEISNGKITHSIVDLKLEKNVQVYAIAEDIPIIFTYNYKNGKTTYVNSTMLMDKTNRGVLLHTLGLNSDFFLSTILNSQIIDIDDFPAPIRRGKTDRIINEYNMDNTKFYREIWWPYIYNLAKRYDLKYTAFIIGSYNNNTRQPIVKLKNYELEDIAFYGRRFFELGGELGVHGYNHNSLTLKWQMDHEDYSYIPWESEQAMIASLKYLETQIKSLIGDVAIQTYVPPSNIISPEGIVAVNKSFNNLIAISSLYTGEEEMGVLYQEFGPNEFAEGVYNFPRFSAGYHYNTNTMWDIYNGIANFGVMHHFIHPDDVLDNDRSQNKKWSELAKEFESIIGDVDKYFSFLEANTLSEATIKLINYDKLQVYMEDNTNNSAVISYKNACFPIYHYLRTTRSIKKVVGGDYILIDKKIGLYLIKGQEVDVEVHFNE